MMLTSYSISIGNLSLLSYCDCPIAYGTCCILHAKSYQIASLLGQKLADSRATVMKFAWLDPHDSNPEASFQGNSEN